MDDMFEYKAADKDQIECMDVIRSNAKSLKLQIGNHCPNSREKSLALTNLEQAIMWANKAITHGDRS